MNSFKILSEITPNTCDMMLGVILFDVHGSPSCHFFGAAGSSRRLGGVPPFVTTKLGPYLVLRGSGHLGYVDSNQGNLPL